MPDSLFAMTERLAELIQPVVQGDVLIGMVPEVTDASSAAIRVGVVPSDPTAVGGLAHGRRTTTTTGVVTIPQFGWSLYLALTVINDNPREGFMAACNLAGGLLDALEGRKVDEDSGPLECSMYLTLEESRSGSGTLWRQDWGCARMGWS